MTDTRLSAEREQEIRSRVARWQAGEISISSNMRMLANLLTELDALRTERDVAKREVLGWMAERKVFITQLEKAETELAAKDAALAEWRRLAGTCLKFRPDCRGVYCDVCDSDKAAHDALIGLMKEREK